MAFFYITSIPTFTSSIPPASRMNPFSTPGMTAGERRGLIALLIVILVIIGGVALGNRYADAERAESTEGADTSAAADSILRAISDSAGVSVPTDALKKKQSRYKTRRDSSKRKSVKARPRPRSPRDERVD